MRRIRLKSFERKTLVSLKSCSRRSTDRQRSSTRSAEISAKSRSWSIQSHVSSTSLAFNLRVSLRRIEMVSAKLYTLRSNCEKLTGSWSKLAIGLFPLQRISSIRKKAWKWLRVRLKEAESRWRWWTRRSWLPNKMSSRPESKASFCQLNLMPLRTKFMRRILCRKMATNGKRESIRKTSKWRLNWKQWTFRKRNSLSKSRLY